MSNAGRERKYNRSETATAWLLIAPAMVGFALFALLPVVRGILISFTDWNLMKPPENIGAENYRALAFDKVFWGALWRTCVYVAFVVPIQTVLALALGVLLHRLTRSSVVRSIIITPYMVSGVVAAILGVWLFHPTLGAINAAIGALGLPRQPFLGSSAQSLASIAAINIWRYTGFLSILFFAGLQAIPRDVYEAAALDGASELTKFTHITVPLLRPIIAFVVVTSVIGAFQIFDTIAVATKGGPGDSTRTLLWYIYEQAFDRFNMGYATALSIVVFAVIAVISLVQLKLLRADKSDLA